LKPEEEARRKIDALLELAGWKARVLFNLLMKQSFLVIFEEYS